MAATNTTEYVQHLREAAAYVKARVGDVDIALVLGSGLGGFTDEVQDPVIIPYSEIPHLPQPTVSGHAGRLVFGTVGNKRVLCLAGRVHSYEGLDMYLITFAARMVIHLGVRLFIATNAAGGAQSGMEPGAIMVIRDHVNELKRSPLAETNEHPALGPRHPSMDKVYSERLAAEADRVATDQGFHIHQGVYCCSPGPTYETNQEVASGRIGGADAFGMSTAPSTSVAASLGVETFAMSLCTNLAAGMSDEVLTHSGVKDVASKAGPRFIRFMKQFLSSISLLEAPKSLLDSDAGADIESPLPLPHHAPPSGAQVEAAAEFVRSSLSVTSAVTSAVIAIGSAFDEHVPPATASVALSSVPSFPTTSASGRSAKISLVAADGVQLLIVSGLSADGFWPEESTFLAALLHSLAVSFVGFVVLGAPSNGAPANAVVEAGDLIDTTTCHPVPHTSLSANYLTSRPLLSPATADAAATYAFFLGPAFPTPAECRLAAVGAACPLVLGIGSLGLVYAAAAVGISSSVITCTVLSAPSFAMSDTASAVCADAVKQAIAAAVKGSTHKTALPALEYTPHSGVISTYQLTPPNSQGVFEHVEETAEAMNNACGGAFVAVLTFAREAFDAVCKHVQAETLPADATPHLSPRDALASGTLGGQPCLVVLQQCFFHLGHSGSEVGHPVRALGRSKASSVFVLSDVASADPALAPGSLALLSDHVALSGRSCLSGPNEERWGERFPDCSNLFDAKLCSAVRDAAEAKGEDLPSSVVVGVSGPCFASLAEATRVRALGANVVAPHSTAEVAVVKHMHGRCCGLALVAHAMYAAAVEGAAVGDLAARAIALVEKAVQQ